jgi:hypothetical protein
MSAFFDDEPFDGRELATTGAAADPRRLSSSYATPRGPSDHAPNTASNDGSPSEQNPLLAGGLDEGWEDSDDDFIPKPPFRFTPLSIGLLALIVIGAGFIGGVLVQKHHDQGSTSSARSGTARVGGFPGGAAGEGFGAAGGTGTATATGTGTSATAAATPAVIGTVSSVSGQTLVVKNLGGKSVTVHLSSTTTVTTSWGAALKAGQTVSVTGPSATDGSVTATAVTVSS